MHHSGASFGKKFLKCNFPAPFCITVNQVPTITYAAIMTIIYWVKTYIP